MCPAGNIFPNFGVASNLESAAISVWPQIFSENETDQSDRSGQALYQAVAHAAHFGERELRGNKLIKLHSVVNSLQLKKMFFDIQGMMWYTLCD